MRQAGDTIIQPKERAWLGTEFQVSGIAALFDLRDAESLAVNGPDSPLGFCQHKPAAPGLGARPTQQPIHGHSGTNQKMPW